MKIRNLYYLIFILTFCICSCKETDKNDSKTTNNKILTDTTSIINRVDSSKIQKNLDTNKQDLIKLFFNSFSKDHKDSYVVFDQVKTNTNLINVNKYLSLNINGVTYPTYLISFPYENDAAYQSILLTNKDYTDGLILFEKVINEGEYVRTSSFNKNKIKNIQYEIEYYDYDNEGNINGNKKNKDSTIINLNTFEVNNGKIVSFSNSNNKSKAISQKWHGKYKAKFEYGKIGGINASWILEIDINKDKITAYGTGYQIGFKDELTAIEAGNNKLILNFKKNIEGYNLGKDMQPEFVLKEENNKYYVESEWIDSDVITKPEKGGFLIKKN